MGNRITKSMTSLTLILILLSIRWTGCLSAAFSPLEMSYIYLPITLQQYTQNVYILSNHTSYRTPWDSLHIVGEVMNDTPFYLASVLISAKLLNSNGQAITTGSVYIFLDDLLPHQKTCFDITFLDPPSGTPRYRFEDPAYSFDGQAPPELSLVSSGTSYNPADGMYQISGQVRNDQASRVECVKVVGVVYNASGKVTGCKHTYVGSATNHDLNGGQTGSFTMDFEGRNYNDVASHLLQLDGNPH